MLSTPHLLVGAAIVKVVPNPVLGLPLALISHFVLDSIPHWDGSPKAPYSKKMFGWIFLDYAFGASLVLVLTLGYPNPEQYWLWLGAFLGTAPDFILGIYKHSEEIFGKYSWIRIPNQFHMSIQRNLPLVNGLIVSTVLSLIAIAILIFGSPI